MEKGAVGVENAEDAQRGVATARNQRRQRRNPLFSAAQLRSFLEHKACASAPRPPGGADGHGNAADLAEVDSSNQVPLSDAELDMAIAAVQTLAGPTSTLDWRALRKLMAEGGASCRLAPSDGAARAGQCPSSAGENVPQCSFPDSSRPVPIPGGECRAFQGVSADDGQASCTERMAMQSRMKTVHRPDKGNLNEDGEESESASLGEAHDVDNPAPTSVPRGTGPGGSHGDGDVAQRLEFEWRPSATKEAGLVKRRVPEQDHGAEPSFMDEEVSKKICVGSDAAREQLCGHGAVAARDGFGVSDSLRNAPEAQQDRAAIGKSPVVDAAAAPKASEGASSQLSSRASNRGERISDEEKEAEAVDDFDNVSMHDGCDVDPPHEEEAPPRATASAHHAADHSPGESSRPAAQGRTEARAAIKAKKPSKLKLRPQGRRRMKIKKLTDEHVKKILNNECEDIKVSPESTTMMDHDELERLCTALSQNTSANRLDLEQCGVGDDACKFIKDLLLCNKSIHTLDLNLNQITDRGCRFLAAMLLENKTLQELYLNGNEIEDKGVYALRDAVVQRGRGKLQIFIKGNRCSTEALNDLQKAILEHRRNGRGGQAVMPQSSDEEPGPAGTNGARAASRVESNDDDAPLIPPAANVRKEVISVSDDSEECSQCRHVDEEEEGGGGGGGEEEMEKEIEVEVEEEQRSSKVVREPTSTAKSSKVVTKVLKKIEEENQKRPGKRQKELDLRGKEISASEFHCIFLGLRNSSIQKLDLNANANSLPHLGDYVLKDLVDTLLKSKTSRLEWIDLAKTGLSNGAVRALLEGLEATKTITYVDLRGNAINKDGWAIIKQRLKKTDRELRIAILKKDDVGYDEWINHDEGGGTLLSRGCEGFVDSDEEEEERGEGSSQSEGECDVGALARALRREGDEGADSGNEDLRCFEAVDRSFSARNGKRKRRQTGRDESVMGDISGDAGSISGDADSDSGDFRKEISKQVRSGLYHSSRLSGSSGIGKFFGASGSGAGARGNQGSGDVRPGAAGGSAHAQNRQKGAGGHSNSGASSHRSSTSDSLYANVGPSGAGFGALQPTRTTQSARCGTRGDGGMGRGHSNPAACGSSASHRPDNINLRGPAQPHICGGGQLISERANLQSGSHTAAREITSAHARPASAGATGEVGTNRTFGKNYHNFPRTMPLKSLKYAFERQHEGLRFVSQWREAQPLEQRHWEAIEGNDTIQTIGEGLRRCEALLVGMSQFAGQRLSFDAWDATATVNFFEFLLVELRNMTETGNDITRSQTYISVLRHAHSILVRSGNLIKGVEDGDGGLEWLRLYTQFNCYLLQWLQVMVGPAWQRAAEASERGEEDARLLRQTYSFSLHSARLLRIVLFIVDSRDYSSDVAAGLFERLTKGRDLHAVGKQAGVECILELWSHIIRLQDGSNDEEGKYWPKLGQAFDHLRCDDPDGFYFTLPNLQKQRPGMTELHSYKFDPSMVCAKDECVEFWWLVTAFSTALYYLYGIPRVGGWDILSQLLNNSPLIHGVQAVGRREQPQLDYLLQLIDRCSLLVTLWPYTDVNGKHVFGNLNLVRELTGGSSRRTYKGLISELWRLIVTENPDSSIQGYHSSQEELARVGELPSNYPFCSQDEIIEWIRQHGGGDRSLCGALTWLIQNWVLRSQDRDISMPAPNTDECEKAFDKIYSSLQHHLSKKSLLLDPASRAKSPDPAPCSSHSELRKFRSSLLILSILIQLASEQNKVAKPSTLFKRMADTVSIPTHVNVSWHFDIDVISRDEQVRKSFITACCRVLKDLRARRESFQEVSETLQKMLRLAVLEIACTKDEYDAGSDISTIPERKKAASDKNVIHFTPAQDAESQKNFTRRRTSSAGKVLHQILTEIGDFVEKWLRDSEKAILENMSGGLENGRSSCEQAYERVSMQDEQLGLFGSQLMPIVKQTDPPPYCNEELTVAIWAFFERNFHILNEVSQNIYSFIMLKFGPSLASTVSSGGAGDMDEEEDESLGSYDWGELENGGAQGARMTEQDARSIAMRMTNQIMSWRCSKDERRSPNKALFKAVALHMITRIKQPRTQSTDHLLQQAVRTWASVEVIFLRSGHKKWNELPLMQKFDDLNMSISCLSSLLANLKHDVSLDSNWFVSEVKYEMVRIWLLAMFDSSIRKHLILEFLTKAENLPLMAGIHLAMADPLDSTLTRPKFPHLYEQPNAATSLLVLRDEVTTFKRSEIEGANDGTYFQERIQGLRKFADGIAALVSGAQAYDETLLCKALGASPKGQDQDAAPQVSWKDIIKKVLQEKVSQEIESKQRVSYLLYCLEAFAVLAPHCAVYLHKHLTMNRRIDSNALIDLIELLFFDDFNHPHIANDLRVLEAAQLRVLEARATCVPAAIMGFTKLTCDKRLVDTFGSLMAFVLLGAPPSERTAGWQLTLPGAGRREKLLEVFNVLFSRDAAVASSSEFRLKQSSPRKVNSAHFMVKVLVHSLFNTVAPSLPGDQSSASAAAEVVRNLLKFLERSNDMSPASDSASISLECIQEVLFLAAKVLPGGLEAKHGVTNSGMLMDIVNAALCLLTFYLNANKLDSEPIDAAISSRVSNPALLQASLQVISCRAVLAVCQAFMFVDGRRGVSECATQEATLSQKLLEKQKELTVSSALHDAENPGHATSQRMLDGGILRLTGILDRMQSLEEATRYDNCDEALTAVSAGAVKVLKRMLDLGETAHQFAIWCARVTDGLVSSSPVKESVVATQCRHAKARVALWKEFFDHLSADTVMESEPLVESIEAAGDKLVSECAVTDAFPKEIGHHSGGVASSISSAPEEVSTGVQDEIIVDAHCSIFDRGSGRACADQLSRATNEDGPETMWLQDVEQISDSENED